MNLKYVIVTHLLLAFSALQYCYAQSTLNLISTDSVAYSLKVNDELVTDSFTAEIKLTFPTQTEVFVELLDSGNQVIVNKDLALASGMNTVYALHESADNYDLKLLEQSELVPEISSEREMAAVELADLDEVTSPEIVIQTEYHNPAAAQITAINEIDEFTFETEKIKAVKKLITTQNLSQEALNLALLKISYEDKRAALIIELKQNLNGLLDNEDLDVLFKLSRYRTQVAETLGIK